MFLLILVLTFLLNLRVEAATVCHKATVTLGLVCASRHCHSILQKSSHTKLLAQISQETLLLLKFVIAGLHSSGERLVCHALLLVFYNLQILILKHSPPFAVATWLGWVAA